MKALVLVSGGLDSLLAAKIIKDMGIDVYCVSFKSPFFSDAKDIAEKNNLKIKVIDLGIDYFSRVVKKPKHGYGKNMNPCIDCHIYLLKKAKKYADQIGAEIIVTGEVLGQRPMSQHMNELILIEKESGLKGRLLRPLSAKLLEKTDAEKKGLIDRKKLFAIEGRQRKEQFELAKKFNVKGFKSPAGGCLLTCEAYARKVRDLTEHEKKADLNDLAVLKFGRHFRFGKAKIIVGRNEEDNKKLLELKKEKDIVLEAADVMGPATILRGAKDKKSVIRAAELTAFYSDAEEGKIKVGYDKKKLIVSRISKEDVEKMRI